MKKTTFSGPTSAKIMIVGEAPGVDELRLGVPFVGASGQEFRRILADAGIDYNKCFVTNVCKYGPRERYVVKKKPDDINKFFFNKSQAKKEKVEMLYGLYPNELIREGIQELYTDINRIKPEIIIAVGNTALWALRGENGDQGAKKKSNFPTGITNWRGSQLYATAVPRQNINDKPIRMVPIIHPASILRKWSDRFWTVHDLKKRVVAPWKEREYNFYIRPSYETAMQILGELIHFCDGSPTKISVDIETRARHIACIGFAWSTVHAICIPLMCIERASGYWTPEEEFALILRMRKLLSHPNAQIVGQNYDYDQQYIIRYWGVKSKVYMDTMIAHHTLWPGSPKGLDFLSSIYCQHHIFWKNESKEWQGTGDEEVEWRYNCKDAVITYEVSERLEEDIKEAGMWDIFQFQNSELQPAVLNTTLRGVLFDDTLRNTFIIPVLEHINDHAAWFQKMIGFNINSKSKKPWYNSPQQTMSLFYDIFNVEPVFKKGSKSKTSEDAALPIIGKREPLLRPICEKLQEYRSLCQFYSNYLKVPLDDDKRIRCQFKLAGTETFRFSSSTDAFGYGTNLQNISAGNEGEEE